MKAIKKSVSFVIYNDDKSRVLAVKRPKDDRDLPNIWGLPAGSLKIKESFEQAVLRSGKEKLGVELEIIKQINEGKIERRDYVLYMKLFEVRIIKGKPKVPQFLSNITQYQKLKWAKPKEFINSAKKVLCVVNYFYKV